MRALEFSRLAPTNHIFRFYELEDFLKAVADAGYQAVDLWTCGAHYYLDHLEYQDPAPLKDLLARYGLRLTGLTPEQTNPKAWNLAAKSPALIQKTLCYFSNAILAARELGSPRVLITSGWQFYSEERREAWDRAVSMVKHLCAFAGEREIILTIEPLSARSTTLVNNLADMGEFLAAVDAKNLNVTIDTDTVLKAGEKIQDYFQAFGERIDYCHLMDEGPGNFSHLAFGDGATDIPELLSPFVDHNYGGDFALEYTDARYFRNPGEVYCRTKDILGNYFI